MQFRVSNHRLCCSDTYSVNGKSNLHTKCRIPIQISLPSTNMFPHIISQIHVFGKCFHRFYRIRALLLRALLIRALLLRARVVRALHIRAFFGQLLIGAFLLRTLFVRALFIRALLFGALLLRANCTSKVDPLN